MYRQYEVPFKCEETEGISVSVGKEGDHLIYRRECLEERVEKILAMERGKVNINPVEPLTTPKEITPYFLVEFERAMMVEPGATKTLFVRFPIEMGVYVFANEKFERLDTFSLVKQKFTLYGDPRQGIICKYWKTDVYVSAPEADPFHEGIMELKLVNNQSDWIQVTQAVFNAYGMKIYYDNDRVSMKAQMEIGGAGIAETEFIDSPLEPGMKKALEVYRAGKLSMATTKFTMELGL